MMGSTGSCIGRTKKGAELFRIEREKGVRFLRWGNQGPVHGSLGFHRSERNYSRYPAQAARSRWMAVRARSTSSWISAITFGGILGLRLYVR